MLSSRVSEIMTTNLTTANVATPVFQVMQRMSAEDVGRVIITDDGVPVGIFTERDVLRRVVSADVDAKKMTVKEVMSAPIQAVREESHIVEAFGKMIRGRYRHLMVRGRRGSLVGIISMRRILKVAVELGQGKGESRALSSLTMAAVNAVDESSSVRQSIDVMIQKRVNAVVVTDNGYPTGIFTERDVLKRVATTGVDTRKVAVKRLMTAPLLTMPETAFIGDALAEMYRRDIRHMPVRGRDDRLTGLVLMADILQYAQAFDIDEQVRRSWKEVAEYIDNEDQYTPG